MSFCSCSVAESCPTLWPHILQHTSLPCPSLSPGVLVSGKGEFQGSISGRRGPHAETAGFALKLIVQWSDHSSWLFSIQLIFSAGGGLLPFLWGHFSELWYLMSWLDSGPRIVNFFHLLKVSVSIWQLRIWFRILSIVLEKGLKVLDYAYWLNYYLVSFVFLCFCIFLFSD